MNKRKIYAFIHKFPNITFAPKKEASAFFFFFSAASILELFMSRMMLALSYSGRYCFHLAARFAPAMAQSALLSVVLAVGGAVVVDLVVRESSTKS